LNLGNNYPNQSYYGQTKMTPNQYTNQDSSNQQYYYGNDSYQNYYPDYNNYGYDNGGYYSNSHNVNQNYVQNYYVNISNNNSSGSNHNDSNVNPNSFGNRNDQNPSNFSRDVNGLINQQQCNYATMEKPTDFNYQNYYNTNT
jgi:hypothetical protein